MRKEVRFQLDRYTRMRDFGKVAQAHFPEGSRGHALFTQITELITRMESLEAERRSVRKVAQGDTQHKAAVRDDLWALLRDINRSAISLSIDTPGLDKMFSLPAQRNERELLATAQQFLRDARPLAARFIEDEMPEDFLTELEHLTEVFSEKRSGKMTAQGTRRTAREETGSLASRGADLALQLDSLVRNKFRGNVEMLSRWQFAARHERVAARTAAGPEKGKSEE
ncbi:MAG: hypothetical protein ACKV2V_09750 [Blastocatellia bacterium]